MSIKKLYRINRHLIETVFLRFEFAAGEFGDIEEWYERINFYSNDRDKLVELIDEAVLSDIGQIFYDENYAITISQDCSPYEYYIFNKITLYERYEYWSSLLKEIKELKDVDETYVIPFQKLYDTTAELIIKYETDYYINSHFLMEQLIKEITAFNIIEQSPIYNLLFEKIKHLPIVNAIYKEDIVMLNHVKKEHPELLEV